MTDFLLKSAYWGVALSLASYFLGDSLYKKYKKAIFNPILISVVLTTVFLLLTRTNYSVYKQSASFISWFLTPATICLAIPIYEQIQILKVNKLAIILGIASGVLTSFSCIFVLAMLFGLSHVNYVTILPKSITTAIGLVISEQNGGYPAITAVVIILTGIIGNITGPIVLKFLKIKDPVACGVAMGTSSHAIGTTRAFEMGQIQGSVSSLSIVVSGILTVLESLLVCNLI